MRLKPRYDSGGVELFSEGSGIRDVGGSKRTRDPNNERLKDRKQFETNSDSGVMGATELANRILASRVGSTTKWLTPYLRVNPQAWQATVVTWSGSLKLELPLRHAPIANPTVIEILPVPRAPIATWVWAPAIPLSAVYLASSERIWAYRV